MWIRRIFSRPSTSGLGTTTLISQGALVATVLDQAHLDGWWRQLKSHLQRIQTHPSPPKAALRFVPAHLPPPLTSPWVPTNVVKSNASSGLFRLIKHIPYTAGTQTDKNFHKVWSGNGKEWNIGLTSNCTIQKGFSGAGGPINTPLGIFPNFRNLGGFRRNSTISSKSSLTSSIPANVFEGIYLFLSYHPEDGHGIFRLPWHDQCHFAFGAERKHQ